MLSTTRLRLVTRSGKDRLCEHRPPLPSTELCVLMEREVAEENAFMSFCTNPGTTTRAFFTEPWTIICLIRVEQWCILEQQLGESPQTQATSKVHAEEAAGGGERRGNLRSEIPCSGGSPCPSCVIEGLRSSIRCWMSWPCMT